MHNGSTFRNWTYTLLLAVAVLAVTQIAEKCDKTGADADANIMQNQPVGFPQPNDTGYPGSGTGSSTTTQSTVNRITLNNQTTRAYDVVIEYVSPINSSAKSSRSEISGGQKNWTSPTITLAQPPGIYRILIYTKGTNELTQSTAGIIQINQAEDVWSIYDTTMERTAQSVPF